VPSIQVKDVPEEVHAVLRRRAAAAGQTLQEYLLARLRDDARALTVEELFERIEYRTAGRVGFTTAARAVRADRAR
jgi:antitoxin FitA